jgi:hypothetical protein
MMPALGTVPPPYNGDIEIIAFGGVTAGDWIGVLAGVVMGAVGAVLTVLIARRQRRDQLLDRAADQLVAAARRAEEEQRQRDEQQRQERLARRDEWRAEYGEIRQLLVLGEDIVYKIVNDGPRTAAGLTALGLDDFRMEAEQLAGRSIVSLRDSLADLGKLARGLSSTGTVDEGDVIAAYASAGTSPIPLQLTLGTAQRRAIEQDRAARDLGAAISGAWLLLGTEWGA